jgi:hypothetical protein
MEPEGLLYRTVAALAIALTVAVATGCDSTPTAPSTANVAGMWGGTTCPPSFIDACVIELTIAQAGPSLSGTYGRTSGNGTLTGTVTGSTVSMSMTPIYPSTASMWNVNATANGDQMTGTAGSGPITLSRASQ